MPRTPSKRTPSKKRSARADTGAAPRAVPDATSAQRAARGKAARRTTPRSAHAEYVPAPDRPDPLGVLEAQSAARVLELVPIRYARTTESPFRLYRGAAAIMAADLATTPDTGIRAQLCGDAHLLNFRLPASPERQADPAEGLQAGGHRPQGRRRRQCGNALLDHPAARAGR